MTTRGTPPDPRVAQAFALLHQGQPQLAEVMARQLVAQQPEHPGGLMLLALLAGERGDVATAIELLERARRTSPSDPELLFRLALAQRQAGRHEQALAAVDEALAFAPGQPALHNARGLLLKDLGRAPEALAAFDRALAAAPRFAEAANNRGVVLRQMERWDEALASFAQAAAAQPGAPGIQSNIARTLHQAGRPQEALAAWRTVLQAQPGDPAALSNAGVTLHELGRYAEAVTAFEQALRVDPQAWETWMNLGAARDALRDPGGALQAYDRALAAAPGDPALAMNRGNALLALGRFEEALACFETAAAAGADDAQLAMNTGNAWRDQGRPQEALRHYEHALSLAPEFPDAHFNLSLCLLAAGDWERAWREYEWRFRTRRLNQPEPQLPGRRWRGEPLAAGGRFLLDCEQGLGDTLLLCRCARLLDGRGVKVVFVVQPPLVALMRETLDAPVEVIADGDPLPEVDWHCPLFSVPAALGGGVRELFADGPWLRPDAARVAAWRAQMEPGRPHVGLAWSGNPGYMADRRRSIRLERLLQALPAGPVYWCLQKDVPEVDRPALQAGGLRCQDVGFEERAAQMAALDLVISVDTSLANLAGAAGANGWVLLPRTSDFRWGLQPESTPWYPSLRLWRQPSPGDWDTPLQGVARAMRDRFGLAG